MTLGASTPRGTPMITVPANSASATFIINVEHVATVQDATKAASPAPFRVEGVNLGSLVDLFLVALTSFQMISFRIATIMMNLSPDKKCVAT